MNISILKARLQQVGRSFSRLRIVVFIILVALLYGFIVWRIQTLSHAVPDSETVAAQSSATSKPQIDKGLVNKIKQLEDTKVTVKALFDQARKNPFHE